MSRDPRFRTSLGVALVLALAALALPLGARIAAAEYAARRDSLAAHVDSGVVIAFSGRTPITDVGPFDQLAGLRYLTCYAEPDAAVVIAVRARGLAALGLVDSANAMLDPPWPANGERNPTPYTQVYLWMVRGISRGLGRKRPARTTP